jgi:hypothetical protein
MIEVGIATLDFLGQFQCLIDVRKNDCSAGLESQSGYMTNRLEPKFGNTSNISKLSYHSRHFKAWLTSQTFQICAKRMKVLLAHKTFSRFAITYNISKLC